MKCLARLFSANFVTTGLAMFAMFFGSGNLIFPVAIGQMAGEQNSFAILGLFITAVLLPFFTLCLMLLFDGDYHRIFNQIGVIPGKIVAFAILALIGPFGVLPRCIAFSFSTLSIYTDAISLTEYSLVASVVVFLLSIKKSDVVGIVGNLLTPFLLVSLVVVIIQGLKAAPLLPTVTSLEPNLVMFKNGFIEGYKTFDIFAALFFATAIMPAFRKALKDRDYSDKRALMSLALRSSVMGMMVLFAVYAGLSYVSANLRGGLENVPADRLLGIIATLTMGKTAGLVANIVVSLACLTTAITLAVVSAEFFRRDVFFHRLSYFNCLVITMTISLAFSLLGFSGIMRLVLPMLMVICPAVIVLTLVSALNYFFGFKYIKTPVYLTFAISLLITVFS